ncbi:MAG: hypothetical protein HQ477_03825 [Chloroflexi bacterium]|nr:hypothetical protein [Chloroflexota bacterium]
MGARCPDCSSIGRPAIFRSSPTELMVAIALSAVGAIGFGIAYAVIVWVLWVLPLGFTIGSVAASITIAMAGSPVGNYVRRVGKNKLDTRLRIIAAFTMFLIWMIGLTVATMLGVWNGVFINIVSYIGLGIGIYVAMNRVRP